MNEPDTPPPSSAAEGSAPKGPAFEDPTSEDTAPEDAASEDAASEEEVADDFGPPFVPKTFGGAFVWAKGEGFTSTVLRIKESKSVPVATENRHDLHVMLTGGRAVLEIDNGAEVDRVELMPAEPLFIDPQNRYRLIAMTEVEIMTVYSPA